MVVYLLQPIKKRFHDDSKKQDLCNPRNLKASLGLMTHIARVRFSKEKMIET